MNEVTGLGAFLGVVVAIILSFLKGKSEGKSQTEAKIEAARKEAEAKAKDKYKEVITRLANQRDTIIRELDLMRNASNISTLAKARETGEGQ